MAAKFVVSVDDNYSYLPTLYWLLSIPKLHKGYDPLINFPYTSIQRKDSFSFNRSYSPLDIKKKHPVIFKI